MAERLTCEVAFPRMQSCQFNAIAAMTVLCHSASGRHEICEKSSSNIDDERG